MKVESKPEVHFLAFPETTAKIIYVLFRGPARKVTTLTEEYIDWEE